MRMAMRDRFLFMPRSTAGTRACFRVCNELHAGVTNCITLAPLPTGARCAPLPADHRMSPNPHEKLSARELALIFAFWTFLAILSSVNRLLDPRGFGFRMG